MGIALIVQFISPDPLFDKLVIIALSKELCRKALFVSVYLFIVHYDYACRIREKIADFHANVVYGYRIKYVLHILRRTSM